MQSVSSSVSRVPAPISSRLTFRGRKWGDRLIQCLPLGQIGRLLLFEQVAIVIQRQRMPVMLQHRTRPGCDQVG